MATNKEQRQIIEVTKKEYREWCRYVYGKSWHDVPKNVKNDRISEAKSAILVSRGPANVCVSICTESEAEDDPEDYVEWLESEKADGRDWPGRCGRVGPVEEEGEEGNQCAGQWHPSEDGGAKVRLADER